MSTHAPFIAGQRQGTRPTLSLTAFPQASFRREPGTFGPPLERTPGLRPWARDLAVLACLAIIGLAACVLILTVLP